jgi:putative hydrolase of the HAD superfamily
LTSSLFDTIGRFPIQFQHGMIKAVFFDFYNTLATHHPPREEAWINACREFGINLEAQALFNALPEADMYWRDEEARSPVDERTTEEKIELYTEYATKILHGAGIEASRETALQILAKLREYKWEFKVYDDSLPTLEELKNRGLIIGLVSNVIKDMEPTYTELGIQPYLDFKVTSSEVGYDKPRPEIFEAALKKAQVKPEESIFVGDQYHLDIVGARGVGIKGVLIDRNDYSSEITDCPRIHSLTEITQYV